MPAFVHRVRLRNYKSVAACDVSLAPLTLLVGPNGSGKSNFLDSLRFVSDALHTTLEQALRERGGVRGVRRISRGHPTHFGIRLDVTLDGGRSGWYAFTVAAEADGGFLVQREECRLHPAALGEDAGYVVEAGRVVAAAPEIRSVIERDRLALVAVSALPEFRPLYEGLCGMGFYNLAPQAIRDLQDPDPGHMLARDGRNLASVLRELGRGGRADLVARIDERLRAVSPDTEGVEPRALGPKETLEFRQRVQGDEHPWRFLAASMSDGTLRALGVLVAVLQAEGTNGRRIRLVGIEEPEAAIHPGAAEVLAETLLAASDHVQVLATTHSPDLLDHEDIRDQHVRAVRMEGGRTIIGPVDAASRSVLREGLYTAGELLRQDQLEPGEQARTDPQQLDLFGAGG